MVHNCENKTFLNFNFDPTCKSFRRLQVWWLIFEIVANVNFKKPKVFKINTINIYYGVFL